MFYRFLLRPLLFLLYPEYAHHLTMGIMSWAVNTPFLKHLIKKKFKNNYYDKPLSIKNLTFDNHLGLAAGFDKNAQYLHVWEALGFGHVEIGTVTPRPQKGNPKPRLFRLPFDEAMINRMGFNNDGVDVVVERLRNYRKKGKLIIGGNIGKNKTTPNENAIDDYKICFEKLFDFVDYFTVNISSPNTPGLRDLQNENFLKEIVNVYRTLEKIKQKNKPIFVKIAPDLNEEQAIEIADAAIRLNIDGLVVSNTTLDRSGLKTPVQKLEKIGSGGLSGKPLFQRSTHLLREIKKYAGERLILIGCGGIFSGNDACSKLDAGADLVQIYTGFVFQGPALLNDILKKTSGYGKSTI